MALAEKLRHVSDSSKEKIPKEARKKMKQATEELKGSGAADKVLKKGDPLPPFVLPNMEGQTVSSMELLQKHNLVLSFYRGVW